MRTIIEPAVIMANNSTATVTEKDVSNDIKFKCFVMILLEILYP